MSAKAMRAMPSAGSSSEPTSPHSRPDSAGAGSPWGNAPTTGRSDSSPNAATTTMAPMTAMSTPGTRLCRARGTMMTTRLARPITRAVRSTSPSRMPCTVRRTSWTRESPSMEKPSSFGIWPTNTTSAMPLR